MGSSLGRPSNAGFGCESALRPNVFTNQPELQPTGQTTCSLRSNGRIGSNRNWAGVPRNGRVRGYSVRSGPNPARLRLTIFTGSLQFDPEGQTTNYSCCTARYLGPIFRPRRNAVTVRTTNLRVQAYRRPDGRAFFDVIGLTALGPGSLPLFTEGRHFGFAQGSAVTTFYYPFTRIGEPRPESNAIDGLELLLRWTFTPG
ncbi:MAG: hypothetical protein QOE65_2898 [Solirubrobacteraceae bacterium]|jgi:hypothetical protein|nr:hypothetical protein [Solirubrobacteraceae bacterium]